MDANTDVELAEDKSGSDAKEPRTVSQAERMRLLKAFDRSGLTQREFCRREGVNYHTFVTWLGWRRHQPWRFREARQRSASPDPFCEVVLEDSATAGDSLAENESGRCSDFAAQADAASFEALLTDGIVVRTASAQGLVAVLRLLRKEDASC